MKTSPAGKASFCLGVAAAALLDGVGEGRLLLFLKIVGGVLAGGLGGLLNHGAPAGEGSV